MPPIKHTGFLAYVGSEVSFWVVLAAVGGVVSCAIAEQYALTLVLAGVAAGVAFVVLFRAEERATAQPGLFYCERCQYYFEPHRIKEQTGAI